MIIFGSLTSSDYAKSLKAYRFWLSWPVGSVNRQSGSETRVPRADWTPGSRPSAYPCASVACNCSSFPVRPLLMTCLIMLNYPQTFSGFLFCLCKKFLYLTSCHYSTFFCFSAFLPDICILNFIVHLVEMNWKIELIRRNLTY